MWTSAQQKIKATVRCIRLNGMSCKHLFYMYMCSGNWFGLLVSNKCRTQTRMRRKHGCHLQRSHWFQHYNVTCRRNFLPNSAAGQFD